MHDLSSHFTADTAAMIADAWTCVRDGTDKEPIREHYRRAPKPVRAVIAAIMEAAQHG